MMGCTMEQLLASRLSLEKVRQWIMKIDGASDGASVGFKINSKVSMDVGMHD